MNQTLNDILNQHAQEFKAGHLEAVKQAIHRLISQAEERAELRGRIDECDRYLSMGRGQYLGMAVVAERKDELQAQLTVSKEDDV